MFLIGWMQWKILHLLVCFELRSDDFLVWSIFGRLTIWFILVLRFSRLYRVRLISFSIWILPIWDCDTDFLTKLPAGGAHSDPEYSVTLSSVSVLWGSQRYQHTLKISICCIHYYIHTSCCWHNRKGNNIPRSYGWRIEIKLDSNVATQEPTIRQHHEKQGF